MNAMIPLVVVALVLGAGQASADTPTVYHSMDGVDSGDPLELWNSASETLKLYIDAGAVPSGGGTACTQSGDGDELCGIDVRLEVAGGGLFTGFTEGPTSVTHHPDGGTFDGSSSFRLNVLQTTSPPTSSPQLLGTVTLDNRTEIAPNGSSVTARGQAVGAGLQLVAIPERVIAVPEPAELLLLGVGISGLVGLDRLRRRTRREPDPRRPGL